MASKRSRTTYEGDLQKQASPYVFFGTPLPLHEDHTRDDGSFVPIWKQEVTDDRGRKRLHGAFTGGFSAGYFNTVGSKEGWTPTTFKSSRKNRASESKAIAPQRPEDFMDEEDIREAEETKDVLMAETYAGFGSTGDGHKPCEAFMDIFRPTGETIGVKLLRKMGWREGQGIGPKVRRKAKLDENGADDNEGEATHLFAPKDTPMISFNPKFDHKGLGWEGELSIESSSTMLSAPGASEHNKEDSDDDNHIAPMFSKNGRKGMREPKNKKGAFGVGILNDTGSDDEDPYQIGPKISYSRVIGGGRRSSKKPDKLQGASNPLLRERPIFVSKGVKGKSGFRKCHDGRLPLDGFVLSTESDALASLNLQDEKYEPPKAPEGWISKKQPFKNLPTEDYESTAVAAKLSSMDAKKRAALLGEELLPGKSVFDFLAPAARDRIAAATGRNNLPAGLGEKPPEGFGTTDEDGNLTLQDVVPKLDSDVAMQALNRGVGGWMPYAEDEQKRARYRTFLEGRAGIRVGLPDCVEGMSKDDWINEMHEFARAAQVFRPVTGMMASRFTTSSSHSQRASDGLESLTNTERPLGPPPSKPEDPAVNAARMGMFGPLTRSVRSFLPTRLLCKRFNVKPPAHVQVDPDGGLGKDATATSTSNTKIHSAGYQLRSTEDLREGGSRVNTQKPLQSSGKGTLVPSTATFPQSPTITVDAQKNDALEAERPSDEVFKAIFGSDEEDDR